MADIVIPPIPEQLEFLIRRFGYDHKHFELPDMASGECGVATWNFQDFIEKNLMAVRIDIGYGEYVVGCPDARYDCHTFALYASTWVIDFTGRQFWPDSPFPLVESLDVYSRRFDSVCTEDGIDLMQGFHRVVGNSDSYARVDQDGGGS